MADNDADTATPDGKKGFKLLEGKSQAQREKILVGVGIGTLIVTILVLKRSSANATAAANTGTTSAPTALSTNPTPGVTNPTMYGYGSGQNGSGWGIDPATGISYSDEIGSLSSALASPLAPVSSAPTSISSSPTPGSPYPGLDYISNPHEAAQLQGQGFKLIDVGTGQYFNPQQALPARAPAKK